MGCRGSKRNETVGGVQLLRKQEMSPGFKAEAMFRGKQESFDLERRKLGGVRSHQRLCAVKKIQRSPLRVHDGLHMVLFLRKEKEARGRLRSTKWFHKYVCLRILLEKLSW